MPKALEMVMQLEKQGLNDVEIIAKLQEQGLSAQEINDALNQSRVKSAVSSSETEMQPSIMTEPMVQEEEEPSAPSPIKKRSQAVQYAQQQPVEEYQYEYTTQQGGVGVETIEEIAEEVVNERFNEIKKRVGEIVDFKQLINSRIAELDDRVKRIESSIDKLQLALLGRVQEFGQDIKYLGSEMQVMEGAFSKILNPLIDNIRELNKITERIKEKKVEKASKEEKK